MPLYRSSATILASAVLTGTPTAPTPTAGDNDTSIATTAFVTTARTRGCLATKAADQTAANYTTLTAIAWDTETGGYDTDAIHDNSTNPSRLTVPVGVTKVQLVACVDVSSSTADTWHRIVIGKNGAYANTLGMPGFSTELGGTTCHMNLVSPIITVVAGDYFEVFLQTESDTSITVETNTSCFAMEIIA